MTGRVEKLVPAPDIALVEGLDRRTARDHQMERNSWHPSRVRLFDASHRPIILFLAAGRRPAFFQGRFKISSFFI